MRKVIIFALLFVSIVSLGCVQHRHLSIGCCDVSRDETSCTFNDLKYGKDSNVVGNFYILKNSLCNETDCNMTLVDKDTNEEINITVPKCSSKEMCGIGCTVMPCRPYGETALSAADTFQMERLGMNVNEESTMSMERNLLHTTCSPIFISDKSTLNDVKKYPLLTFRFGVGRAFEDFELMRFYFPMSDAYCGYGQGHVDRFTNYFIPYHGDGEQYPVRITIDGYGTINPFGVSGSCEFDEDKSAYYIERNGRREYFPTLTLCKYALKDFYISDMCNRDGGTISLPFSVPNDDELTALFGKTNDTAYVFNFETPFFDNQDKYLYLFSTRFVPEEGEVISQHMGRNGDTYIVNNTFRFDDRGDDILALKRNVHIATDGGMVTEKENLSLFQSYNVEKFYSQALPQVYLQVLSINGISNGPYFYTQKDYGYGETYGMPFECSSSLDCMSGKCSFNDYSRSIVMGNVNGEEVGISNALCFSFGLNNVNCLYGDLFNPEVSSKGDVKQIHAFRLKKVLYKDKSGAKGEISFKVYKEVVVSPTLRLNGVRKVNDKAYLIIYPDTLPGIGGFVSRAWESQSGQTCDESGKHKEPDGDGVSESLCESRDHGLWICKNNTCKFFINKHQNNYQQDDFGEICDGKHKWCPVPELEFHITNGRNLIWCRDPSLNFISNVNLHIAHLAEQQSCQEGDPDWPECLSEGGGGGINPSACDVNTQQSEILNDIKNDHMEGTYSMVSLRDRLKAVVDGEPLFEKVPVMKACGLNDKEEYVVCINPIYFEMKNYPVKGIAYTASGPKNRGLWPDPGGSKVLFKGSALTQSEAETVCNSLTPQDFCLSGDCSELDYGDSVEWEGTYAPVALVISDFDGDGLVGDYCIYNNSSVLNVKTFGWCAPCSNINMAFEHIRHVDAYAPNFFADYPIDRLRSVGGVYHFIGSPCRNNDVNDTLSVMLMPEGSSVKMFYYCSPGWPSVYPPLAYLKDKIRTYLTNGVLPVIFATDNTLYDDGTLYYLLKDIERTRFDSGGEKSFSIGSPVIVFSGFEVSPAESHSTVNDIDTALMSHKLSTLKDICPSCLKAISINLAPKISSYTYDISDLLSSLNYVFGGEVCGRTSIPGEDCNDLFSNTDVIVLNIGLDVDNIGVEEERELHYSTIIGNIENISREILHRYGKPVIVNVVQMSMRDNRHNTEEFFEFASNHKGDLISSGVIGIQFEDIYDVPTGESIFKGYNLSVATYCGLNDLSKSPMGEVPSAVSVGDAISSKRCVSLNDLCKYSVECDDVSVGFDELYKGLISSPTQYTAKLIGAATSLGGPTVCANGSTFILSKMYLPFDTSPLMFNELSTSVCPAFENDFSYLISQSKPLSNCHVIYDPNRRCKYDIR